MSHSSSSNDQQLIRNKSRKGSTTLNHCSHCDYKAYRIDLLRQHEKIHSKNKPFKCPHPGCSYRGRWRSSLHSHLRRHDTTRERIFQCPLCPKKFTAVDIMRNHTKTHTKERHQICPQCPFSATHIDSLRRHMKKFHGVRHPKLEKVRIIKCSFPGCTYQTPNGAGLAGHRRRMHETEENHRKPFACHVEGCDYRSTWSSNVLRHVKVHHDPNRPKSLKCPHCGRYYERQKLYRKHVLRHKNDKKPRVACPCCGQLFILQSRLTRHLSKFCQNSKVRRESPSTASRIKANENHGSPRKTRSAVARENNEAAANEHEMKESPRESPATPHPGLEEDHHDPSVHNKEPLSRSEESDDESTYSGPVSLDGGSNTHEENAEKENRIQFVCSLCGCVAKDEGMAMIHSFTHRK